MPLNIFRILERYRMTETLIVQILKKKIRKAFIYRLYGIKVQRGRDFNILKINII